MGKNLREQMSIIVLLRLCVRCDKLESIEDILINIEFFTGCLDKKNVCIFYNVSNQKYYQINYKWKENVRYTSTKSRSILRKIRCFIVHNMIT